MQDILDIKKFSGLIQRNGMVFKMENTIDYGITYYNHQTHNIRMILTLRDALTS
jgi:hypothetical protein|tara:strand:- start:72 stop:233 length:162 start_codon:yes stop_codon:yes gene_type:complete